MHRLPFHSGVRPSYRRRGVGVLLLFCVASGAPARAATFTVNSLLDTTDGTCASAAGGCTLREAIEAANGAAGRDAILFDPAVFPSAGFTDFITVNTLPVMTDPAGIAIDGDGATVRLNCSGSQHCFAFATAPGVPLAKVTVANLGVLGTTLAAIDVCGGGPPSCEDDVSDVRIERVAVGSAGGIKVEGGGVSKVRIADTIVSNSQGGIFVEAEDALVGTRVERSATHGAAGIYLLGEGGVAGVTIQDALALIDGIIVQSSADLAKVTIADATTFDTIDSGARIIADGNTTGATITNVVASKFGQSGVQVAALGNQGVTVRRIRTDRGGNGVALVGVTDGGKFQDLVTVGGNVGVRLFGAGTSLANAKITDVVSVANQVGVFVNGPSNKLKNVTAVANVTGGIGVVSGGGGSVVEKSRAMANGGPGIILDAQRAAVRKNVALGNGEDLEDDDPACGTNVWEKNVFRLGSAPCIR